MLSYTIGDLSAETGCKIQTIRYYEQVGLLPAPRRTEGKQRRFEPFHRERVNFIRHARGLGFPLGAIRELLELADSPHAPCERVDRIAERQLQDVNHRIDQLTALRDELQRMLAQCRGGEVASCRVLEVLSDHRACARHDDRESP